MISVTEDPIDFSSLFSHTTAKEDGATACFLGTVRNFSNGRSVKAIEYEAYVPMALESFQKIIAEAKSKWGITKISVVHRIGLIVVGEASVAIVASSPHRREALSACSYAINRIKTISPIWKKEIFENGDSSWADSCNSPPTKKHYVHAH